MKSTDGGTLVEHMMETPFQHNQDPSEHFYHSTDECPSATQSCASSGNGESSILNSSLPDFER